MNNRLSKLVLLGVLTVALAGCSLSAPSPTIPPATNLSGSWEGETRVTPCDMAANGRCNAVNKVTFLFNQNEATLSGSYHCAYGNQICRDGNMDDTGNIDQGLINGGNVNFDVLLPADVSNCRYEGRLESDNKLTGTYNCYQGGSLLEQGNFQIGRAH